MPAQTPSPTPTPTPTTTLITTPTTSTTSATPTTSTTPTTLTTSTTSTTSTTYITPKSSPTSTSPAAGGKPSKLSAGATAGIGIGAAFGAILFFLMAWAIFRYRRSGRPKGPPGYASPAPGYLSPYGSPPAELAHDKQLERHELSPTPPGPRLYEIGDSAAVELPAR